MNTKKYEELLVLLRSHKTDKEILEVLSDYHENDIADMLARLPGACGGPAYLRVGSIARSGWRKLPCRLYHQHP